MKKNTKRYLGIILSVLMAITAIGTWTMGPSLAAGNTIYVSETGNDENSGASIDTAVKTLMKAATLAGADGTVIVADSTNVSAGEHIPGCTIKGLTPDCVINITGWAMRFAGPVTIENITLNAKAKWSYVLAQGHKFVIGDGVTVTADEGISTALSIRGGGDGMEIAGSCEIVLKSGGWKTVVGGTRNKDTKGNTHITIYESATVQNVSFGNENGDGHNSTVKGSGTVKIVGKMNPIPGGITGSVDANRYLDLSEYKGTIPDGWYNSGAIIITDPAKVPTDAKPISEGGTVGVPGTTYDTGAVEAPEVENVSIYLSDSGNDSNDGRTITNAVKTLAKACALAGVDGTVIIADNYTYNGEAVKVGKIEGFTNDATFNIAVWKLNIASNCEFDNLILNTSVNWSYIVCNGFKFTAGENVKVTKSGNNTVGLCIRGGGEKMSVTGNTNVILKGGTWHNVFAGTKAGNVTGNANVTVHSGATVNLVSFGNDAPTAADVIVGKSTLKLVGSEIGVKSITPTLIAKGGSFIDISEFEGKLPDEWDYSGISLVTKNGVQAPTVTVPPVPLPTTGTITDIVPGVGVIYVSDNGSNMNDGKTPERAVKTIENAISKGGANPTIVVVDKITAPTAGIPACTLVGYSSESLFMIPSWAARLSAPVKFENITIMPLVKFSYILAQGNSLTIGKNVTVEKGPGVTTELGIRGGGEGTSLNKNSNIEIMSGSWGDIHGGTRNASINGDTFITIHEGANVRSVNVGNNGVNEGNIFNGNGVIKLVGNPKIGSITEKPEYQTGEMLLDLTEFTGTQVDGWNKLGANVVTDEAQLPEYVAEHFSMSDGGYDLSEIKLFRFISDRGDDTNDGLTKEKPMKSMKAAVKSMGEGGTVIVTGQYTHTEYTSGLPSFNITSASNKDNFVMGLWTLHTSNTKIYNVNIIIPKDYYFILHGGKSLHIGKNVNTILTDGAKVLLSIRGNESGDVAMTDITIESGDWATVYTGTKNANVLGDASVTVKGGNVNLISAGNDSETGRILGSTKITLEGKPAVKAIGDKSMCDGYSVVDMRAFEGSMKPTVSTSLALITDSDAVFVPVKKAAIFINGYPDGTFLPEKVMTRAEAVTVVSKVAGITSVFKTDKATAFSDLTDSDWYAPNVKYLESFGALGFWGNTLDANKGITRGEFVKLISGMIESTSAAAPGFTDVTASHPYYNEIIKSAKAGLVTGYPDGTFLPDNTLKRSEIVTILNRLTARNIVTGNTAKITKFSDIAEHWAAPQIIAASCEPIVDNIIVWYTGDVFSANSPVDKSTIELTTTKAVLEGVDVNDANAVAEAVEAYAVVRRAEIANTATAVEVKGTKYYVAADGNDENDGKSPETAWKTLEKVNLAKLAEGDGVFFRRGDIFRGQLTTQQGVTYSAYGEGAKPALYGSLRNYSNSGFWTATGRANIYVSSEEFSADVGLIVFDEGKEVGLKEALGLKGFIGSLTKDLQFFHDKNDNKIYLYSTSDPNTRWSSTEIAQGRHGVAGNGNGVTIDNLCIKYSGAHGLGYGNGTTGLTVQNCEIGWIGGMLQNSESRIVRYGNGVEIYVGCKDYTITNCHIYQCYDAGVTHQYFQTKEDRVDMENIKYTDNVIEYCTYNIEYVNAQPADKGIMRNVEISGNLLIHGAEGWGQQRDGSTPAVIKGWSEVNNAENAVYTDNVIMTTSDKCILVHLGVGNYSYMPELYGNLFVGKRDCNFGHYGSNTDYNWLKFNETITDVSVGLDDNTMVFIG